MLRALTNHISASTYFKESRGSWRQSKELAASEGRVLKFNPEIKEEKRWSCGRKICPVTIVYVAYIVVWMFLLLFRCSSFLCCLSVVTLAVWITLVIRHLLSSGHWSFFLQLHPFCGVVLLLLIRIIYVCVSTNHPYLQPEGWITKGAAQRDRPNTFERRSLAAAKRSWMTPEHSSQGRCFWLG